jgi:imidazolonepropionase-like amidohydrolase
MQELLIRAGRIFDGDALRPEHGLLISVRDGRIVSIRAAENWDSGGVPVETIDASGLTVLPGLIDAHFHPVSSTFDIGAIDRAPPSLRALDARQHLEAALRRGFTTVRDAGGADIGLVRATEQGLIRGPRLLVAGKAISQTGGHGDMRPADLAPVCNCGYRGALSVVVDGPDQMRAAARDQLRQGANHIKIFVSGGVLSPTDPIWMNQFTDAEIQVAVEEAATRNTYVMAHAHTAYAVRRCVRNGVRSIEHGTFMDRQSADEVAAAGAFVVPTISIVDSIRQGPIALPPAALEKLAANSDKSAASVEHCVSAGVKLGFGTDLFGALRDRQADEFTARGRIQKPIDVLRSATRVNAELLNLTGQIGELSPGACADLIAVEGNPLSDLKIMADPERFLKLVIRDGKVIVNRIERNTR